MRMKLFDDGDDIKELFDVIWKIRNKVRIFSQKDVKLFDSNEDDRKKENKVRPMYIKYVNSRNLIEKGANFDDDDGINEKLDDIFGKDENDMFLKEFFKNKLWIDNGNNNVAVDNEVFELLEDEKELLKQEEYERDFNFRFEDYKSDQVLGHSRFVDASVRIDIEKKKEMEKYRQEEVKRLKILKRKEIEEKIRKIEEIAGINGVGVEFNDDDLETEFDPEEFDGKMKNLFGDEYYGADDVDPEFRIEENPDSGKEDELLGLPKDWDVIKSSDGFLAKRGNKDDGEIVEEGKRKRKSNIEEALRKDLKEELCKYDYEDAIGDLKTWFKYRKVKRDRSKLSAAKILWLDEQELNRYVSLGKLATYREQEWKVPSKRKGMLLEGVVLNGQKEDKKRKIDGEGSSKTSDEQRN